MRLIDLIDLKPYFHGKCRRIEYAYNNTHHYQVGWEAGACKYAFHTSFDCDQVTSHHNLGDSFWLDINNDNVRIARVHGFENARYGIHFELTSAVNGVLITNCLQQGGQFRSHSYWRLLPASIFISAAGGTLGAPIVIEGNQIEVPDNKDFVPSRGAGTDDFAASGLAIYADNRAHVSDHIAFIGNVVIYEGKVDGMPQSGMMENSATTARVTAMQLTAAWGSNTYYHTGPDTDKIFHYVAGGTSNRSEDAAAWQAHGYDTDAILRFDQSAAQIAAAKSSWVWGDMPTWSFVKAT